MHVLIAGVKAEECTYFFCMSVSSDTVSHMQPFFPCYNGGRFAILSSSGSGSDVGDQHLPLPMAYGTHVLHESGYLPNKTHSNTAGK